MKGYFKPQRCPLCRASIIVRSMGRSVPAKVCKALAIADHVKTLHTPRTWAESRREGPKVAKVSGRLGELVRPDRGPYPVIEEVPAAHRWAVRYVPAAGGWAVDTPDGRTEGPFISKRIAQTHARDLAKAAARPRRNPRQCPATLTLNDPDYLPLRCAAPAGHTGAHGAGFGAGGYEWTGMNDQEPPDEDDGAGAGPDRFRAGRKMNRAGAARRKAHRRSVMGKMGAYGMETARLSKRTASIEDARAARAEGQSRATVCRESCRDKFSGRFERCAHALTGRDLGMKDRRVRKVARAPWEIMADEMKIPNAARARYLAYCTLCYNQRHEGGKRDVERWATSHGAMYRHDVAILPAPARNPRGDREWIPAPQTPAARAAARIEAELIASGERIYPEVLSVAGKKRFEGKLQSFEHDFTPGPRLPIIGTANGSLLIPRAQFALWGSL